VGAGVGLGPAGDPPPPHALNETAKAAVTNTWLTDRIVIRTISTSYGHNGVPAKRGMLSAAEEPSKAFWPFFIDRSRHATTNYIYWVRHLGSASEAVTLELVSPAQSEPRLLAPARLGKLVRSLDAGVAELADAHGSGPCWLRLVWVQVPPPASSSDDASRPAALLLPRVRRVRVGRRALRGGRLVALAID